MSVTFSIAPSIESQESFFTWEIRLFPLRKAIFRFLERVANFYLDKLIQMLDQAYTDLQGALVVLKGFNQTEAQRDLPSVKRALKLLITYKGYLEKADYLGSDEVKTKITLVISTLYDIETELKKKAFAGQRTVPTDANLVRAIGLLSEQAISKALSR